MKAKILLKNLQSQRGGLTYKIAIKILISFLKVHCQGSVLSTTAACTDTMKRVATLEVTVARRQNPAAAITGRSESGF
jgi:hypothetical protein